MAETDIPVPAVPPTLLKLAYAELLTRFNDVGKAGIKPPEGGEVEEIFTRYAALAVPYALATRATMLAYRCEDIGLRTRFPILDDLTKASQIDVIAEAAASVEMIDETFDGEQFEDLLTAALAARGYQPKS